MRRKPELQHPVVAPAGSGNSSNSNAHDFPLYLDGGRVKKKPDKEGGEPLDVCARIEVQEVRRTIDNSGRVSLVFSYDHRGQAQTRVVSRGILTRRKIMELLAYGVDVTDQNTALVLQWLRHQEENAPLRLVHNGLGFTTYDGRQIFRLHEAVGCDSLYAGELLLEPTGTLDSWLDLVRTWVLGRPALELALVIGFAGVVASYLTTATDLEVIVLHLYGLSSKGKTTAARLAVSPFGYPHIGGGGLLHTWTGSDVRLLAHFRDNHGVTMVIDDSSAKERHDYSSLIYQLAQGRDRDRLTKEGLTVPTSTWSGVVLSTSEQSLLAHSNRNAGLRTRLFEFGNVAWTDSKEQAERLTEGLLQNYGHAGPVLARHLMALGADEVRTRWDKWREEYEYHLTVRDDLTPRISRKMAVLMVAAELTSEALDLPLNIDAIMEVLLAAEATAAEDRNVGESAYSFLLESIAGHRALFETGGQPVKGPVCWGKVVDHRGERWVFFLKTAFAKLLAEGGYTDADTILKLWRERGYLDCEGHRLTRKKAVQGQETRVYAIRLPDAPDGFEPPPRRIRRPAAPAAES